MRAATAALAGLLDNAPTDRANITARGKICQEINGRTQKVFQHRHWRRAKMERMAKAQEKMLMVSEVAARLGQSERNIRNWAKRGVFPGAVLQVSPRGPYWLIPESDLKSFSKPVRGRPGKPKAVRAT